MDGGTSRSSLLFIKYRHKQYIFSQQKGEAFLLPQSVFEQLLELN
jgi:hypothetical protein